MKLIATVMIVALVVTGCAHDNYTVVAGGMGSSSQLSSDLHNCKHAAAELYAPRQTPGNGIGILIGGVVGGAIGGAAAAGVLAAGNSAPGVAKNIDAGIERCMADRGYAGTSDD